MAETTLHPWCEDHSFGQDQKRPGEGRTLIVIGITATMMLVEIVGGLAYGSMALLADGLHMGSHAAALTISAFAYIYARRKAHDRQFSFGTGKVNALGGFTGAVLLALFALLMVWESIHRLIEPVEIAFNAALIVATIGLAVNALSAVVLGHGHDPAHDHAHEDEHEREHACEQDHHHHDHNLRAAYLHVLADALTSVLAILALLVGKYAGLAWLDPLVGILGAVLITHWSIGLIRATSRVLLDQQAPRWTRAAIRDSIESHPDSRVVDLHVWSIGPQLYAAEIVVVAASPLSPYRYKQLLPSGLGLAHVAVEVHHAAEHA